MADVSLLYAPCPFSYLSFCGGDGDGDALLPFRYNLALYPTKKKYIYIKQQSKFFKKKFYQPILKK